MELFMKLYKNILSAYLWLQPTRPQVVGGRDGTNQCRGAANILAMSRGRLTRYYLPAWGLGARLSPSQNKKASCFEMLPMTPDLSLGRSYSMRNGTETWNLEYEEFLWTRVTTTDLGIWNWNV